jgi:tetratricopeptide (TPR) repeat protein
MAALLRGDGVETLQQVRKAVDELYYFRDHYFETHGIDSASQKLLDVEHELEKTLVILNDLPDKVHSKAEYLTLRGRALNVMPHYSKEAEDCLSKAVKLEPKLADAWIILGECYWKNNQIELARNCFTGALGHTKSKVALRNLSMVMRQMGESAVERAKNIEESVSMAKQAVQLDITDGTSWFILGNAYLTMFFAHGQNPSVLKQCLSAYQQAEKDSIVNCNADLHYNRATVYQFQEDFELSLIGFNRALALDPTFSLAVDKRDSLIKYLTQVSQMVDTKGRIRGKKLQSVTDSICADRDLGAYSGGSYTSPAGRTVHLKLVTINQLQTGLNTEMVIVGRVVCSVNMESSIMFTFCMVDKTSACCSVTVYNIAKGWGIKIGDSVAIPEPFLHNVDVHYQDQHIMYKNIRVARPVVLVVNGRKLTSSCESASEIKVSTLSE